MTMDEMVAALESGQKVRRPSWPEGDYVEAEGTGDQRKVSQMTMLYHSGGSTQVWALFRSYDADFSADDFEILT